MLTGFTNEALVVFPLWGDYVEKGSGYKTKLNKTVSVIHKYLHANNINMDFFATDDVAHEVVDSPDRWVIPLNRGDMFFVKNNCEGGEVLSDNIVEFEDVYVETAEKYPLARGIGAERRFEITLKRDSMAKRIIARKYKLVFIIKQRKSPAIRYTAKKDSGVIYVEIDNVTFNAECWMSDMSMDAVSLLEVQNGFMPVYEWEV